MQINIYSKGFHARSWRKTASYSGPYFHVFKIHQPTRCDSFLVEIYHHLFLERIFIITRLQENSKAIVTEKKKKILHLRESISDRFLVYKDVTDIYLAIII